LLWNRDAVDPGSVGPQLSSVATALAELTARLSDLAEALAGTAADDVANGLFEVERLLRTAGRRLDKVVDDLGEVGHQEGPQRRRP
jgi:hypothetical protein